MTKRFGELDLANLPVNRPGFAAPMKPHLTEKLPRKGDWIYEIKFDGYRVIAVKNKSHTTLYSRNHKDLSQKFPGICEAVSRLPAKQVVIDGEIVALLKTGLSSFQHLQNHARSEERDAPPIFCYAFDILHLDGRDTTGLPLRQRKQILKRLFADQPPPLRFSDAIDTTPDILLNQARKIGLEGIVAKDAESRYQIGRRSGSWLKIKLHHEQEFVIGGYTHPRGNRSHFGAILIGVYDHNQLHYVGRVGTGFDEKTLQQLHERFEPLRIAKPPFANLPTPRRDFSGGLTAADMKRCVWLRPELVCQVRFSEWTTDGSVRHPVFLGLRDDKLPRETVRERHPQVSKFPSLPRP